MKIINAPTGFDLRNFCRSDHGIMNQMYNKPQKPLKRRQLPITTWGLKSVFYLQ